MNLGIECEREEDGRWLAEGAALPGMTLCGASANEAMAKAEVLAPPVLAGRLEHGATPPFAIDISVPATA